MFKRIESTKLSILAVAVAAILFVSVNIISNVWFGHVRADLTAGNSFSTSAQLRPIFQNIGEPIVVRLYYSEAVGEISARYGQYYQRVRDLLQQYSKLSGGKIVLELYSPEPFSDVEDRAVGLGLQAVPLNQNGEVGYFGLAATNSTDDTQVIPFFTIERERFLEYDLAKLIYTLSRPTQPKVGLITSLPMDSASGMSPIEMQQLQMSGGNPPPPWAIMQQVREFFSVVRLQPSLKEIPAGIDMLMLVQPENLTPDAQLAIDQFVLKGGKVLAFVDPIAETRGPIDQMNMAGQAESSLEGIKKLMTAWGVKLVDGKVAGDADASIRVNMGVNGRPVVVDYVAWLHLQDANLDPNDAVTGNLKQIDAGTMGVFEQVEGATTTVSPLLMTGPSSMRIDASKFQGVPDIVGLFREFKPQNKQEVLAVRVAGHVKSAFPEAPIKESLQPAQIILVGDTDILTDRFWVEASTVMGQQVMTPTADNASFVVNALENLTGSPALSSLRGHGLQSRPFTLLEDYRRDAEMKYRSTEQGLTERLDELQKKASAMQPKADGSGGAVLSDQDKKTIETYRADILSTRRELRDVQRALRENIEGLQSRIMFANTAGVPIIFGLILVAVAVVRHRRRKRRLSDV